MWRAVLIPTRLFGLLCCVWLGIARLRGENDGVIVAPHSVRSGGDCVVVVVVAKEFFFFQTQRGGSLLKKKETSKSGKNLTLNPA